MRILGKDARVSNPCAQKTAGRTPSALGIEGRPGGLEVAGHGPQGERGGGQQQHEADIVDRHFAERRGQRRIPQQ